MAAHQPPPRGGRILVMTSSGAGASLMADKASEYGIELAEISEEAQARVPQRRTAILTNPFDTAGASRSPGFLTSVCEAFAADAANHCMLMYLGPLAVRHEYARNFAAAAEKFGKTAAAIIMLSEPDVRQIFQQHHVPVFDAATDAAFETLRAFIEYGKYRERPRRSEQRLRAGGTSSDGAVRILAQQSGAGLLRQAATTELLQVYGLRCAEYGTAGTFNEASALAERFGYPVILKAVAQDVAHRSEAGLVSGKISTSTELDAAFAALRENGQRVNGADGTITVEKFVAHDFEIILGVKYESTFGPVVLCGAGGVFAEVLRDYALRLAPLTRADAEDMLRSLKASSVIRKLTSASSSWNSLVAAILRLSDLAVDLKKRISAVDINPLALSASSSEIVVLDAKIHI